MTNGKQNYLQISASRPFTDEGRSKFLAQAKINVPIEEKSKFEDLLCKHHDVFSKDKAELGKAKYFKHKID